MTTMEATTGGKPDQTLVDAIARAIAGFDGNEEDGTVSLAAAKRVFNDESVEWVVEISSGHQSFLTVIFDDCDPSKLNPIDVAAKIENCWE